MGLLLVVGIASLLCQVTLLRELTVAFYGVELVYVLAIGAWMLGTAIGAGAERRSWRPRPPPGARAVAWLLSAVGLLLVLDVALLRGVRLVAREVPGAFLPFERQLVALAATVVPFSAVLGVLFRWAARSYIAHGHSLARAYAIESGGAVVGGIASSTALWAGFSNYQLVGGTALLCGLAGWRMCPRNRRDSRATLLGVAALLGGVVALAGPIDTRMTRWTHPDLIDTRDSPYGRLTFTGRQGQVAAFENDALLFESASTDGEVFVHLVALQHERPTSVLVLGGGVEGLVPPVLQHEPERVDVIELDAALAEMTSAHVGPLTADGRGRAAVRLTIDDPRRALRRDATYDLILVGTAEPVSGQANRLFTREFFERCAARLAPGGRLGLRLRTPENLWTPRQVDRAASIVRALRSVFPHTLVLPGTPTVITASYEALPEDPAVLVARFDRRRIEARLVSPPFIRYVYTNDRRATVDEALRGSTAPANTDVNPACYRATLLLWLERVSSTMPRSSRGGQGTRDQGPTSGGRGRAAVGAGLAAVALAAAAWLARRRLVVRRAILVALVAMAGMLLETVALLAFQVKEGVIYRDVGLLLTAFMAGLAIGAALVSTVGSGPSGNRRRPRWASAATVRVAVLLGVLLLVALGLGRQVAGGDFSLIAAIVALAVTGGLVGAVFAEASLRDVSDQGAVVAPLYAADLLGGSVGAVAAGLLLVPFLGLDRTAFVAAALALVSLLFV